MFLDWRKSKEDLKRYYQCDGKNESLIGIKSNFKKGTKEVATFPNEIIRFFGSISFLNTLGNRSSLISLLKQFETKFLRNFEINGKICSVNKKVFPLRLEISNKLISIYFQLLISWTLIL